MAGQAIYVVAVKQVSGFMDKKYKNYTYFSTILILTVFVQPALYKVHSVSG